MSRTIKETADWFKHPHELRNTTQMRAIRNKFSNDGYAVYNYLIEMMCGVKNFELDYNEKVIILYSAEFGISVKKFTSIVNFCIEIDALIIDKENKKITSPNLKEYLKDLLDFREKDRNRKTNNNSRKKDNEIHKENSDIHMENGIIQTENNQSREEKSNDNNSLRSSLSSSSPTTTAHIHEELEQNNEINPDRPLTASEGVKILKAERNWLLQMQWKYKMETSLIATWLDSFVIDCDCRGKQQHKSLSDIKQHFNDWMTKLINVQQEKSKKTGTSSQNITIQQRWNKCHSELCKSVNAEVASRSYDNVRFLNFDDITKVLMVGIPNKSTANYIEENLLPNTCRIMTKYFGQNVRLNYQVLPSKI